MNKNKKKQNEQSTFYSYSRSNLNNLNNPNNFEDFDLSVLKKVEENFMNDDFFKRLLVIVKPHENQHNNQNANNENNENNNGTGNTTFEKILEFAHECYIHGIITGMSVAIDIFKNENN